MPSHQSPLTGQRDKRVRKEGSVISAAADGPELTTAKRLLDLAKRQGFVFQRVAPGPDGPLFARRETIEYRNEIYIGGFATCATRSGPVSLPLLCPVGCIVPSGLPVTERVTGDALTVVSDWPPT